MTKDLQAGTVLEETTIAGFPATVGRPEQPRRGAPTVLFLHGAFADHACFRGWVRHFSEAGYPSVAAARRGRLGVGPERAAGLRFDAYGDDTLAVIDALGASPVLVGHSLGGLVAQRLAELGRARAIALLAP